MANVETESFWSPTQENADDAVVAGFGSTNTVAWQLDTTSGVVTKFVRLGAHLTYVRVYLTKEPEGETLNIHGSEILLTGIPLEFAPRDGITAPIHGSIGHLEETPHMGGLRPCQVQIYPDDDEGYPGTMWLLPDMAIAVDTTYWLALFAEGVYERVGT